MQKKRQKMKIMDAILFIIMNSKCLFARKKFAKFLQIAQTASKESFKKGK